MYKRILKESIINNMFCGRIIMLLGPRQTGKTTLVETIISEKYNYNDVVVFSGDYFEDRELLGENSLNRLKYYIDDKKIIFIDEAQKIENIGNSLKIIVDKYKKSKQLIVTGSSSINLLDKTSEPLTGRKIVFMLYPISVSEYIKTNNVKELYGNLESMLIYGSYPEVTSNNNIKAKQNILKELVSSNLYRDIIEFQQIKNSNIISKLLKLLSLQIGKEVSINELATTLGIDMKTVDKYIDLLEKSYVIFRLPPYFTNKRKEISKSHKIYFYDLGVRNTIIRNYNDLSNRNDKGDMWENFLIVERIKRNGYLGEDRLYYFWRTYNQSEIDYLEEYNGKLIAFEFKWKEKNIDLPKSFITMYPGTALTVINKSNFLDFI